MKERERVIYITLHNTRKAMTKVMLGKKNTLERRRRRKKRKKTKKSMMQWKVSVLVLFVFFEIDWTLGLPESVAR